jgi:hypothetical protein
MSPSNVNLFIFFSFASSTEFCDSLIEYLYAFSSQLYNGIMSVCLDSCGIGYVHFINSLEL